MDSETPKPGVTGKDLALYIGVPIACACVAGGAYYLYTKSGQQDENDGAAKTVVEDVIKEDKVELANTEPPKEPDSQGYKNRGNKYFKAGHFDKAIECYTKAIDLCPDDKLADKSTFYQNRAAAKEQLKNYEEVVEDCTSAIELNSKYSKALHRRAKAYESLDKKRNCLEDVTAVCLLEGFQNQQCMILADRILKSIGRELAAEYFKKRPRTLPSPTFIKSYLDSFNKSIFDVSDGEGLEDSIYYTKVIDCMKNRDYDNIIDMCDQEIESNGKCKSRALLLRGTLKTLMCDVTTAISDFNQVLELEEDDDDTKNLKVDALIKRGSLKMQQANDVGCYADLSEALQINDKNPNIYHHRGQLYFLTERLDEAKKDFQKAIGLDDKFVAPRIQLGYCLCKIAMQMMSPAIMKEANDTLDETTQLFPDCHEAWSLYGQLLQDQQRLEEASIKLEKAISISPNTPTTYVYKALLTLQWKQDLDEANKLIRKAIELDDKCDFAFETLATLEVQKGNNEEAIKLFERAIDLVRTESEMANTFSLLEAAKAQSFVTKQYGIKLPENPGLI